MHSVWQFGECAAAAHCSMPVTCTATLLVADRSILQTLRCTNNMWSLCSFAVFRFVAANSKVSANAGFVAALVA